MDFEVPFEVTEIRTAVRELCSGFPGEYWRALEPDRYPDEFVAVLTQHGWLGALIPQEYGGAGLGLTAASVILEEINAAGCNAGACHAQMYVMGTLLRHGSEEQKQRFLPKIAAGELRLQAFGITEPTVGSDTTQIQTRAEPANGGYVISGQKIWTSRALHSDLMLLLARTTPLDRVEKRTEGLSVFLLDMKSAGAKREIRPIKTMINHATTEVFLDGRVPGKCARRRGGARVPVHPRRDERRADPDRRRVHRRRALVRGQGRAVRLRAGRLRPAGRGEPGCPVPDRSGTRGNRGRGSRPLQGRLALRAGPPVRRGGERREAAGLGGLLAGRERVPRHARRLRIRRGVRRGAEVPRDPSLLCGAHLEQSRSRIPRPARPRDAEVVLAGAWAAAALARRSRAPPAPDAQTTAGKE